jgi:hypothetical protein
MLQLPFIGFDHITAYDKKNTRYHTAPFFMLQDVMVAKTHK